MDNTELTPQITDLEKEKKQVERSAAYPSHTISEALVLVKQIAKVYPGSYSKALTREDIGAIYKSSYLNREIASAVKYGLLDGSKGEYKLTPLFKKISAPIGNEEIEGKIEAFKSPKLYQELIELYNGHALPRELPTILYRNHRIALKASEEAANTFIDNAKEIGLLNEYNVLNCDINAVIQSNNTPLSVIKIDAKTNPINSLSNESNLDDIPPFNEPEPLPPILEIPEINNESKEKIRLTGNKKAFFIYPSGLTSEDKIALRKWFEYFESTI